MSEEVKTTPHAPKVSVIVPVYKAEKYLRKCVDSILAQTFKDFEVLLVDDGSPDGSGAICDEYAKKDPRVRVFHKENGGVSSARNAALNVALGKYVTMVDADDFIGPSFLSDFGFVLRESDFYLQGYVLVSGDRESKFRVAPEELFIGHKAFATFYIREEETIILNSPWAKLYRRDLIERCRLFFDERISLGEDHLFVLSYLVHAKSAFITPGTSYHYVKDGGEHLTRKCHPFDNLKYYYAQVLAFRKTLVGRSRIETLFPKWNYMFANMFLGQIVVRFRQSPSLAVALSSVKAQRDWVLSHSELFGPDVFVSSRDRLRMRAVRDGRPIPLFLYAVYVRYVRSVLSRIKRL